MTSTQKFLQEKINNPQTPKETYFASLLLISAVTEERKEKLKYFTYENIRGMTADRHEKWGNGNSAN